MGLRILTHFLIIYLTCVDDAFGDCPDGISRCEWLNWGAWGPCSRTCGSGTRIRSRGLCCDKSLHDWLECTYDCGKNIDDNKDKSSCRNVCFNGGSVVPGSSSSYSSRCLCTYLFTGRCCDRNPDETAPAGAYAGTCSWDSYYCWPGRCPSSLADECKCASGFRKVTGDSETTCQLSQSKAPFIETCRTRVKSEKGDMKQALSTTSSTRCRYLSDFYGNFQPKYLIYDMLAEFTVSFSSSSYPKPDYIHDYNFGVTDTYIAISIHPITGSNLHVQTHTIFSGKADSSDANPTLSDSDTLNISTDAQKLTDGQWLCFTYKIKGGGYLRSVNLIQDRRTPSTPVPYRKTQTTRSVCYRYDSSRPEHCKAARTCHHEPLQLSKIITQSEIINAYCKGWNDPIPYKGNSTHASGIESYHVTVHEVLASNGNLASKVDTGIVQSKTVKSATSPIRLKLTSDKPKLYAIYLEVKDFADNVRHARRFVLFDKWSKIEHRKSNMFYVQSASLSTTYKWQTHHNNICLNWTGYFYNRFYLDNPLLNQIKPDQHIADEYEQQYGLLRVSGTPNIHGIVKFIISWSKNNEVISFELDVPHFPQQYYCHAFSLNDGDTYTLNIKAIDIANHMLKDNRTVHIDRSVPLINNIGLVKDGIKRLVVHDTTDLSKMQLYFEALDPHSGIIGIEWAFGTSDSAVNLTTGHIGGTTLNEIRCTTDTSADHKCYCPDIGSCEMYAYSISMNKLVAINKHGGEHNRNYYFTVKATNHAMLSNIEHLDILVDDSPPETGVILEGAQDSPDVDYTSDSSFIVHWHGFIDHESGIRFYKVVLADHCLGHEEMNNISKLDSYLLVEIPYTESSVRLTANFTGKRYTSIVAINNAMDTSKPVCSDGITRDISTPQLANVTLLNARSSESLICHYGRGWLVSSKMQKIQLDDTQTCLIKCGNFTEKNEVAALMPTASNAEIDKDVSDYICQNYDSFCLCNNIIYIPSDHIDITWDVEEGGGQIQDYLIGFGYDQSEYLNPGHTDYASTHREQSFYKQHVGIGSSKLFFLFLKVVNKAGTTKVSTIGPVMIDETPPLFRSAPDIEITEANIVVSWGNETFYDTEQKEQIDQIYFQFGHDDQVVTPLIEWKLNISTPCIDNRDGCIRYPLERLQQQDTDLGLQFYVSLFVYNKAGHFVIVQTDTFQIPSQYPPGNATVTDVDPLNKDLDSDVGVHFTTNILCARWNGFRHHENITLEIGVGESRYLDNVVSFFEAENTNIQCINSSKLVPAVRYHFLLRATCTGGQTLSSSDGVSIITQDIFNSLFDVHVGKPCDPITPAEGLHFKLDSDNITLKLNLSLEIGKTYRLFVPDNITVSLQKEDGVSKETQVKYLDRYFSLLPFVSRLEINLLSTKISSDTHTIHILRCQSTSFLKSNENFVNTFFTFPTIKLYPFAFEAALIENGTNVSNSGVTYQRQLDKRMTAKLEVKDIHPGGIYSVAVRPCAQDQCLQPVISKPFSFVFRPPEGEIYLAEIKSEKEKTCFDITVQWNNFQSESPVLFYQWSLSEDGRSFQSITIWETISATNNSQYQINRCLDLPSDLHKTLYACVRAFTEGEQSVTVCKDLESKFVGAYSTNIVYDVDTTKAQWADIKSAISSSDLGRRYGTLHNSELDFGTQSSNVAGLIIYGTERKVNWFLMNKHQIPISCNTDKNCVDSGTSDTGFIEFKTNNLPENMLYYICAYSNETHIERETFTELLPEFISCSDGFVIDKTHPSGGKVHVTSNERYVSDVSSIRISWDDFKDNIDASKLGYVNNIMSYSFALGSRPGGDDVVEFSENGLPTGGVIDLKDGAAVYVSVKATDHVNLSTVVTSEELIVDTSPPRTGHVLLNQRDVNQNVFLNAEDISIRVFGFHDAESGIDKYEVSAGTGDNVDDIYPISEFTAESYILRISKGILHNGHKYRITLKAVNRAGLSSNSLKTSFIFDSSAPTGGHVIEGDIATEVERELTQIEMHLKRHLPSFIFDTPIQSDVGYQVDVHHIKVHWKGFDDIHSGIQFYRVGLGTHPYEDNIEPMLDVGLNTEITWNISFTPGQKYYTVVEACNNAGLCTVRSSDGIILDNSPPIHGLVRVGSASIHHKYIPKSSSVHLHWYGFEDPQSDIQRFEACIGTRPNSCGVVPAFDCLLQSHVLKTGIILPINQTLYATIRAYNKVNMSVLQSSDAFRVDDSYPIEILPPYFILDYGFVPGFSVQWEPSILKVSWQFVDPDSPILRHTLTLKTHHEGHTPVENIHLGSETNFTIVLDGRNWLHSGDKYFVEVTCCNAAGLCTSGESTDILIDSSPPHLGGFKPPMTWTSFTDADGNDRSNLTLAWYAFHDQESDIDKYFITVSRSYSDAELSDGEIVTKANSSSPNQTSIISLTEGIRRDDLLILSIWAQNRAGINSSIGKISVHALSTASPSHSLQGGVLQLEKHSCDIHYCNNDCTCAVIGKPCTSADGPYNCTILNANDAIEEGLPYIRIEGGLQMFQQTTTASSACLSGHWLLSNYSNNVSRFEWSIGVINHPIGEGIFDLKKENPWKDVGRRSEMIHCLSSNQSLIHREQYVIYVKVWYGPDLSAIFESDPITIDQTPPSVRRGQYIKDSDTTCTADLDFIDWMDTITACWDKVFSEQDSAITHYEIALGTSQNADDVLSRRNVSLWTNMTLNNLTLSHGTRYYFSVTAYNTIGLHTTASSDGFVIDMDKPISGVVFNTGRHVNAAFQSVIDSLSLSWHGFIDHYSGIKSYYVAIIKESEINMTLPAFVNIGLQNTFKYNSLHLQHGNRYVGLVKAVDAAGHESDLSVSSVTSIDTTPPESFVCSAYHEVLNETSDCSKDNNFEILTHVNLIQNSFYKVQGSVMAADIGTSAELIINRLIAPVPLSTNYDGWSEFQYSFLRYDSSLSDITLKGACLSNTTVSLTLNKCSKVIHNADSAITVRQIGLTTILIKVSVLDYESRVRKVFSGLGTTYGGYQVKPLSPIHDGVQSVETVDVPQGTKVFATVQAENLAGLRSVFHSQPVVMDRTPPIFTNVPVMTMKKESSTTYSFEATWSVNDDESGIKQCYCALENHFDNTKARDYSLAEVGKCQKNNVTLKHGDKTYVNVRCINQIVLGAEMSSNSVIISEHPPSVNTAQLMIVPANADRSESLHLGDNLAVQSNQTCIQMQWSGFTDVFGIDNFEYRLIRGQETVTDWADAGRQTMAIISGVHLQSDSVYTAEVRAWNAGRHVSDVVSTDVLILGSGPRLTGIHMHMEKSEQQMMMDWSGVFSVNKLVPIRYTLILGSKYGYNDIIEYTTTKTSHIASIPKATPVIPHVTELFIDLTCSYITGLGSTYKTTYRIN